MHDGALTAEAHTACATIAGAYVELALVHELRHDAEANGDGQPSTAGRDRRERPERPVSCRW